MKSNTPRQTKQKQSKNYFDTNLLIWSSWTMFRKLVLLFNLTRQCFASSAEFSECQLCIELIRMIKMTSQPFENLNWPLYRVEFFCSKAIEAMQDMNLITVDDGWYKVKRANRRNGISSCDQYINQSINQILNVWLNRNPN